MTIDRIRENFRSQRRGIKASKMLIDEIIQILGSRDGDLSEALLKTKILLHNIGKKELAGWVNNELNGYASPENVPEYRIVNSKVYGHISSIAWHLKEYPLPVMHLTKSQRDNLEEIHLGDSIAALANMASSKTLTIDLPVELNSVFSEVLVKGVHVIRAWRLIPPTAVSNVLTIVRSRLLDFLLELRSQIDENTKEGDLRGSLKSVDQLFKQAIFGPNATVIIGDHNLTMATNVAKGDFKALVEGLRSAGVPERELDDLKAAIEEDRCEIGDPSMEGKTGSWFTRLLARATKGGYAVTVDVVTGVVAKLITGFVSGQS